MVSYSVFDLAELILLFGMQSGTSDLVRSLKNRGREGKGELFEEGRGTPRFGWHD